MPPCHSFGHHSFIQQTLLEDQLCSRTWWYSKYLLSRTWLLGWVFNVLFLTPSIYLNIAAAKTFKNIALLILFFCSHLPLVPIHTEGGLNSLAPVLKGPTTSPKGSMTCVFDTMNQSPKNTFSVPHTHCTHISESSPPFFHVPETWSPSPYLPTTYPTRSWKTNSNVTLMNVFLIRILTFLI